MDSFTLQMHYKFTPGILLLILLFIILFYNQRLFIIVGRADNLHDNGKIQTKLTQVQDNSFIRPPRKLAFT